jgi:hypothetical protein
MSRENDPARALQAQIISRQMPKKRLRIIVMAAPCERGLPPSRGARGSEILLKVQAGCGAEATESEKITTATKGVLENKPRPRYRNSQACSSSYRNRPAR